MGAHTQLTQRERYHMYVLMKTGFHKGQLPRKAGFIRPKYARSSHVTEEKRSRICQHAAGVVLSAVKRSSKISDHLQADCVVRTDGWRS